MLMCILSCCQVHRMASVSLVTQIAYVFPPPRQNLLSHLLLSVICDSNWATEFIIEFYSYSTIAIEPSLPCKRSIIANSAKDIPHNQKSILLTMGVVVVVVFWAVVGGSCRDSRDISSSHNLILQPDLSQWQSSSPWPYLPLHWCGQ